MTIVLPPGGPRKPTTAQRLSQGVGRGLEIGQQLMQQHQAKQAVQQLGLDPAILQLPEQAQAEYFKQIFAPQKQMTPLQQSQKSLADERLKALQGQQDLFKQLTGSARDQNQREPGMESGEQNLLSQLPEDNLRQLSAFAGQPGEQGVIGNIAKSELERRSGEKKEKTAKEKQFFKLNEPKLMEISDIQRKLEMEEARYDRLQNLFSDPNKFPSSFTAALFSKEGQINDLAYSQLTPEAQEALKLIIDSTSNIKDTYGARVTNFDLQTYLKKLPSLLNTHEGKMRVLRDLQVMNKINQLHASGIQQIFEEAGGTDKIPFSTADTRYKKRYGSLEKDLKEQFVNPEKGSFSELPDANKYLGRKIKNPETGEIFISDGKEWKPFKG
jgi:hypothetical protein